MAKKKRIRKKTTTKKESTKKTQPRKKAKSQRTRRVRTFPASTFEDALVIPVAIQKHSPGGKIRRLTLFDELGKSADSGTSKQLVTNSGQYGLTTGSYIAEYLELSELGGVATSNDANSKDRLRARVKLAIENIAPFSEMYEEYAGAPLPSHSVIRDFLADNAVDTEFITECIDTFVANAEFLGLLKTMAGAERLLEIDHALDEIDVGNQINDAAIRISSENAGSALQSFTTESKITNWDEVCFYVTPIGEEGSDERLHADLMTASFVEPAVDALSLKVIRADNIGQPGMISTQIFEHLKKAKLVIADLSYLNPNVFYEMALRHALRMPLVQIIRKSDRIPFDVNQVRTVVMDTTDIFSLVPKMETYRSEISSQSRRALEDPESIGNPITVFYPEFFDNQ
ncbi:MAG: hypothetical protein O7G85_15355 [Planctomycetota bacterium]|nr:hypothetical protein [Planctomycetota bacterium]